jgi:hypothetical protein
MLEHQGFAEWVHRGHTRKLAINRLRKGELILGNSDWEDGVHIITVSISFGNGLYAAVDSEYWFDIRLLAFVFHHGDLLSKRSKKL